MGIVKNNILLKGLSGKHGNIVFRAYNKKTFFSRAASKPLKQSAQQKSNRQKFQMATDFAKEMMLNPERKEYYRKKAKKLKLPNPYTAAIADYMRDLKIHLEVSKESGNTFETIFIHTTKKNFDVSAVEITIKDVNNNVIEKGTATPGVRGLWVYKRSEKSHTTLGPYYVIATAIDAAGRKTEGEIFKE